ncbi:phage scaffolding protein [Mammaliicoccus fleurettii]|uniref:phage scaffolding protein n=1 Tax=Mammaliicoccus fleurettii TaxID=150056 RepID=UPI002DBEFA68|nr:phage scaffolding protein [Mammaliicoccus fleurettii]MEB7723394.1 phage scaffolding protein [Mammaliicoccus fleurettii]
MNRESLKALDLSDEQIEKVMAENGKDVNYYKSQLEDKDNEVKSLESEKETLSKQITTLEKKANDYNSLEEQNNKLQEEIKDYKIQVSSNDLDKQILKEVSKDAHEPDDIFLFLDRDKFNYDEESGELTNFHEVMSELREDKPYLFNSGGVISDSNEETLENDEEVISHNADYKSGGQQGNGKPKVDYAKKGKDLASALFPNQKEE